MRVLVEKHETFSHLHKASLGERKKEKKIIKIMTDIESLLPHSQDVFCSRFHFLHLSPLHLPITYTGYVF